MPLRKHDPQAAAATVAALRAEAWLADKQPANGNGLNPLETFPHNAGKVTRPVKTLDQTPMQAMEQDAALYKASRRRLAPKKPKDTRCNITPRTATPTEAAILSLPATPKPKTFTSPAQQLATHEQQQAFCQAAIEHEGILPAARAWGFSATSVFYHASVHPEFRKMLNAAQAAVFETQVYKLDDMCNHLLGMPPKEMNQCANAYGRVFDYRMRIVGKLLPVIYGDTYKGTNINMQMNGQTAIVCTEEQREKLIAMNQKLLNAGSTTTNQE